MKTKKSSQGLPALLFLAVLGGGAYFTFSEKKSPDLPSIPPDSQSKSSQSKRVSSSTEQNVDGSSSEPSRGRLSTPDTRQGSARPSQEASRNSDSQSPASSEQITSESKSLQDTIAKTRVDIQKSPEEDLESQLGREKAAEYRAQEQRAFRFIDEEEDKKELEALNSSLALTPNQDTTIGLVYDESRSAFAQQQETFRRTASEMKPEEKLAAITKLARFREQFIYDRMKSILTRDQMSYYADSLAQKEFERADAKNSQQN